MEKGKDEKYGRKKRKRIKEKCKEKGKYEKRNTRKKE
jgi:hypothetical protein